MSCIRVLEHGAPWLVCPICGTALGGRDLERNRKGAERHIHACKRAAAKLVVL